jgi:hypothetical protein
VALNCGLPRSSLHSCETGSPLLFSTPAKYSNVTIDEMLHPFRGRCPFKVYMPSKPAKYGLKIWILADSETSCCWNVQPYLGKVGQVAENGQGERVVRDLVTPVMASGRNVTVDNLFTSLSLAMWLLQNKLTIVGTIRKNRGEIPECMLPNRNRAELTSIFGFTKETTIVSYVPKKNRSVVLLSTLHHDATIDVGDQCKPEIITFYNGTKGGVDNLDKMCAQYTCKLEFAPSELPAYCAATDGKAKYAGRWSARDKVVGSHGCRNCRTSAEQKTTMPYVPGFDRQKDSYGVQQMQSSSVQVTLCTGAMPAVLRFIDCSQQTIVLCLCFHWKTYDLHLEFCFYVVYKPRYAFFSFWRPWRPPSWI